MTDRTLSSVKTEAHLCNLLKKESISAASVLKNSSGHFVSNYVIDHQHRYVMVFNQASGRDCTYHHLDLHFSAQTLFKLHQYTVPKDLIKLDMNRHMVEIESDINHLDDFNDLKQHVIHMLAILKIQDFTSGDVICHGDPLPKNIFIDHDIAGLIDFEYACVASPCLDLAIMMWNLQYYKSGQLNFSEQSQFFLKMYNSYSTYQFQLNELAPYMVFQEIKVIKFLVQHHYLNSKISHQVLQKSLMMMDLLQPYLKGSPTQK